MRDFVNEAVKNIKPSGIRKFFDIAKTIEGCVSLGVGEPDFDTPFHIAEEGIASIELGQTFYTSNAGLLELREEICNYTKRKYNCNYKVENTFVTVGGSEAIDLVCRACLSKDDEVIIPEPSYVSYEPCVILQGAKAIKYQLEECDDFKIKKEKLEKLITPKTKILFMNFPNNPTGGTMNKDDLEAIKDVIIKHDLLVVTDEIYSELTYEGKHTSIASLEGMSERTILINGFSKAFSMTGWRLGYACGPESIIKQMLKIHQFTIMCASTASQYAGLEALKNGDDDVSKMRDEYNMRRRYVINALKELDIPCYVPKGAFYVFPNIKQFNMSSEDFALDLLNKEKVVVVPGTAFGDCGEGFIRISYAYSLEDLKEAFRRIKNYINKKRLENI